MTYPPKVKVTKYTDYSVIRFNLQGCYKVGTHGNIHSIGSHALSFRDIDLEVGIKNVQKGQAWSIS